MIRSSSSSAEAWWWLTFIWIRCVGEWKHVRLCSDYQPTSGLQHIQIHFKKTKQNTWNSIPANQIQTTFGGGLKWHTQRRRQIQRDRKKSKRLSRIHGTKTSQRTTACGVTWSFGDDASTFESYWCICRYHSNTWRHWGCLDPKIWSDLQMIVWTLRKKRPNSKTDCKVWAVW